jgi:putative transposase
MLYISHTGCQWRFLPEEFGPWTRIWSQFRRWSRNGTWTRVVVALHASSRIVCVDVTGLPLCVRVVPASTSEARAVEQILDDLVLTGAAERLELVLVDRGTARSGATRLSAKFNYEVRRVGWDEPPRNEHSAKVFRPIRHAWRVEVAHGHLVRRRRLARCFENTVTSATRRLHVASISELLRALC